mgnify:CR=1 FL=1
MKKYLFITRQKLSATSGGSIATCHFIEMLTKLPDVKLDLMCSEEERKFQALTEYSLNKIFFVPNRAFCRKIIGGMVGIHHRFRKSFFSLSSSLSEYDLIIFNESAIGSTFVKYCQKGNIKTITIHHNYEPSYYDTTTDSFLKFYFRHFVKKNERIAYYHSSGNVFLTKSDEGLFKLKYKRKKTLSTVLAPFLAVCENYICEKKYDLIITCSLVSKQNVDTLYHFFNEYGKAVSCYSIVIAGRNPSAELKNFLQSYKNVVVIENPSTEKMRELTLSAKVYLSPIEIGGGIKVRCFDAVQNLIPIIAHENAARGYEPLVENHFMKTYKDIKTLQDSIEYFIKNDISKSLYKEVAMQNYSISECSKRISNFIEKI